MGNRLCNVALLFVAPAIGAIGKAGSAAAKAASIASKGIQAAGTAVYGTVLGGRMERYEY